MSAEPTPPAPLPEGKGEEGTARSTTEETPPGCASESEQHSPFPSVEGGIWRGVGFLRFVAFAVFLGLWTWKLLEPNPVPESLFAELSAFLPSDWRVWAAKSLHASAYAFLTVLVFTLPVPRSWRWFFVGLLALHGVATEIGQTFVPGRHGCVRDVLIDWGGIGLGLLTWFGVARVGHSLRE